MGDDEAEVPARTVERKKLGDMGRKKLGAIVRKRIQDPPSHPGSHVSHKFRRWVVMLESQL